jgi:hypothetical protein
MNQNAKVYWLARWNPQDYPEPDNSDQSRIREFMRLKYVEKRWVDRGGAPTADRPSAAASYQQAAAAPLRRDPPPAEPLTKILGSNIPPIRVGNDYNYGKVSGYKTSGMRLKIG